MIRAALAGAGVGCCASAILLVALAGPGEATARRFGWGLGLLGGILLGLAVAV